MAKKRTKSKGKIKRIFGLFFCLGLLIFSCIFLIRGIVQIKTMVELKSSIKASNAKLKELKSEKASLEKKKKNLLDPDYIEYVARGKYLVTKEGEQVFKFPKQEKEE